MAHYTIINKCSAYTVHRLSAITISKDTIIQSLWKSLQHHDNRGDIPAIRSDY